MYYKKSRLALAITFILYPVLSPAAEQLDELLVEGESQPDNTTHYTSPTTVITELEAEGINATTVEDFIKYEPGMVVRKRYIGDANGVVGMRGSNMFQTTRTMVFADGLPLHYFLQTQYSGSPRWSLVAPDETKSMEVVYGPFSAEYSGNAMGGVVNIETRLPQEREFHAEAGMFAQSFQHLGADDTYTGHREFVSYGDRFDMASLYLFHNHLQNDSQPQSYRYDSVSTPVGGETTVTGAIKGKDSKGNDVIYYADSGAEDVSTDLTKLKMGYEFGEWLGKLTLAYEGRTRDTNPTNYLRDSSDNPVWTGEGIIGGDAFTIKSSNFAVSQQDRQTQLIGGGLEGPLANSDWILNADFSYFDILKDQTLSSTKNPADPAYTTSGTVKEYDDTGWKTLDVKARNKQLGSNGDMNLVLGYHYDTYSLNIHDYNSSNYQTAEKTSRKQSTGGETETQAVFAQWGWDLAPQWDVALGARYERWNMANGYYYKYSGDMENYAGRTENGFSPKFSLGYLTDNQWQLRYAVARAYRFPIVEELYKNEEKIDGTSIADEHLKPEVGLHHNLMAERDIENGFLRVNLYHEVVKDVIFNQTDVAASVSTFLPVDEVTTTGLEFVLQQYGVAASDLDLRFNAALTDSEITHNSADPSVEGKVFPRMPRLRAGMLATYHVDAQWDSSVGLRYASNSYGQLDNSDTESQVYGAQDSFLFIDLKANYQINDDAKIAFGVDNVTDEVAFVAHPWSQRTFHVQGSIDF